MRPSHRLCSLVSSVPHLSTAITDRPSHDSSFASPSRKRSISSAASIPLSSPIPGALSYARADLLSSPKRIRSFDYVTDLEDSSAESSEPSRSRGIELEMEVDVVRSDRIDINLKIQAEVDECTAYADALRARGIEDKVVVKAIDRDEVETAAKGPVEDRVDRVTHPAIEGIQRDQGHMIVATGQQSTDMLERIRELERVNMRLRDMMDAAGQRVTRSQRRELRRDQGHRIVATGQHSTDMLERIKELERDNMRLRDMMDVVSQGVT
nr:hypothetical protein [Tanacetum cinerariifolium]